MTILSLVDSLRKLAKVLKPVADDQNGDAAVALLLKPDNQTLKIFFVKRVESVTDPWSGQMALPGGKRDPTDNNLKETVIRETLEETNINLLHRCRFVGMMDTLRTTRGPTTKVIPFVVLLEHDPQIRLNEELERFTWFSPKQLAMNQGIAQFSFGKEAAYIIGNDVIWGLTFRILEQIVPVLEPAEN